MYAVNKQGIKNTIQESIAVKLSINHVMYHVYIIKCNVCKIVENGGKTSN